MLAWLYIFYLQLDVAMLVYVFFDGIADVERLFGFDVSCLRTLSECDAVHYVVRLVVYQFQLDVFLVSAYYFAGAVVVNV